MQSRLVDKSTHTPKKVPASFKSLQRYLGGVAGKGQGQAPKQLSSGLLAGDGDELNTDGAQGFAGSGAWGEEDAGTIMLL